MPLAKAGGMWVSGDRFFDRELELGFLADRVRNGTHTLLTGQRRIGKTSLVRELLRRLDRDGSHETVFVDLEDAPTPADAVAEIAARSRTVQGAWGQIKAGFDQALRGVSERVDSLGVSELRVKFRAGMDAGSWRWKGDDVFAALANSDRPVVLAMDELPILVNRLLHASETGVSRTYSSAADEFLSWLRKNGQAHPGRVCLIVSGSVSLQPILSAAGLSAKANILVPLEVKAWDEDTAVDCLGELASGRHLTVGEPLRREMCRLLRCQIPHHVQQFFDCLDEHLLRVRRQEATMDDVKRAWEALLGVRGQVDLDHYEGRLKLVLGPQGHRASLDMLTEAATNDGWLRRQAIRRYALYFQHPESSQDPDVLSMPNLFSVLEHDGYLESQGDEYRFVSGVLEAWWRARYGSHHVPIAQRSA